MTHHACRNADDYDGGGTGVTVGLHLMDNLLQPSNEISSESFGPAISISARSWKNTAWYDQNWPQYKSRPRR
jgi:hypothetical protein